MGGFLVGAIAGTNISVATLALLALTMHCVVGYIVFTYPWIIAGVKTPKKAVLKGLICSPLGIAAIFPSRNFCKRSPVFC